MTNIGLSSATTANQFTTATPLSGRVLYQQASTGDRLYTQVASQFADGTAEQKNSLSNQFIEAAGQEGIAKLSATPEGQYALQIVYDHASSGGQKLMREVHEGQGNTAVDYTHKNENVCTAEAFQKEGTTPEEQHLNNLMKQYGDHVSGEMPLPPSESIRLRHEIDRVSQLANPGQHNLWGDYSPQEKRYLAEEALQNRQAVNNLGIWVGGPVFSALPALGRVLDAPEPVVEGLGQINAEMAGGKAFGRQGRGIQPVDTPIYSGPVKTYVLDAKSSAKIEQSARVVQGQNIAPNKTYPKSWDKFDPTTNAAFEKRLAEFNGGNFDGPRHLRGGEGQLFLSDKTPGLALKRWFEPRLGDMDESIRRLEVLNDAVKANPALSKRIEVVKVHDRGADWILRDFDSDSIPLKSALKDSHVSSVHQGAMSELKGSQDDMLKMLEKRMNRNPPSANIHWSPTKEKIIIIDML
jgi:hypothetical protein